MGAKRIDHKSNVGKKINMLTCIAFFKKGKYIYYTLACDCGKTTEVASFSFYNSVLVSCGCDWDNSRKRTKNKPRSDIKPNGGSAGNYVFLTYRRNAKLRNYIFELTKEEFFNIVIKNCYYCDSKASQIAKYMYKKNSGTFTYNGIDRFDNTKGYTLDNCVPCCNICNKAKGSLPTHDFYGWIERLVKYENNRKR